MEISIEDLGMIGHTGDNAEMAYNRGLIYLSKNRFVEAINDFSDAINLKLDFIEAYEKRAYCYYNLNNFQDALHDYFKVYNNKQDDVNIIVKIVDAHRHLENYEYAINMAYVGIRISPLNSSLYFHRGLTFFDDNKIEFAISDFLASYKLNANEDKSVYYIGVCLMYLDKKEKAHNYFSIYIEQYSESSLLKYAYYQRAILNNQLGDFQAFKIDLINSAKLGLEEAIKVKNEMNLG